MGRAALLSVKGLSVTSPGRTIVEDINLDIAAGEAVAIVGESGSGKSITARALVNLLPQSLSATGSVMLGSTEVLGRRRRAMGEIWGRRLAMVMQDPFTSLSQLTKVWVQVGETVKENGRRASKAVRRDAAATLLNEVGISDPAVLDRYPFELSGGMRQRVAIAAALAASPELLIADEPTTALDTTTQKDVLALLQDLQARRQMGLVLITHDLRLAFSTCTRVYVLYAGKLLEVSDSARMWREPLHPYTLGLLLSEPPADRKVERLVSVPGSVPAGPSAVEGCVFAPRCQWVRDECKRARPPLVEVEAGHLSACIRVSELRPQMQVERLEASGADEPALSEPADRGTFLVQTKDLSKEFTAQHGAKVHRALEGAFIAVARGESVGLVGESGSGKTTLARCLVGLERPTSGSITIDGIEASNFERLSSADRRRVRSTVQIVFQDPYSSLNPARTIGHTLRQAASLIPGSDPAAVAADLLGKVGLPESYLGRKPGALSGGERQRVAIARSLAVRPSLLICDEVVSALDVSVQAQILNLLADLQGSLGLGLLFVSHDLAVIRQVTERVYVLYQGRIVEAGATSDVLDNPSHDYTRRLVAAAPSVSIEQPTVTNGSSLT